MSMSKFKGIADIEEKPQDTRFEVRERLNLNDLLKKRSEEKTKDKKTNILIFSSASAVAAVVLLILSL